MWKNWILNILLLIIFISCNSKIDGKQEGSHIIDLEKELKNTSQQLSDIFEKATFTLLDTTTNAIFGDISSIKMVKDAFYIFDRKQTRFVYKFKNNGKFIGSIGKLGKGPGEYIRPTDFDINPDNGDISIHCWSTKKILTYDFKGTFKKSFNCSDKFTSFAIVNDLTYCAKSYSKEEPDDLFYCYNNEGDVIFSSLSSSVYQKINKLYFRFGSPIYKFGEFLTYVISSCDTIFTINNNTVSQFLIFNLTKNIRSKLNDDLLQLHAYSQNEEIAFLKLVIGNIPYDLFYFFNTAKTCLFSYADMQDDLTHLPIELLGVHGNTAIGTVYASNIPFISSLITDGKITSPEVQEYIRTQGNGTLIVIYDFID